MSSEVLPQGTAVRAGQVADILLAFRREIHAHPELSWQETATTERIAQRLREAGLEPQFFEDTTGVYVDVGEGPFKAGFRGDIDALPVTELTGLPYASTNDGVAHACGHDIHATVALGVALICQRVHREAPGGLGGRIRVIFQPAEETMPGGAKEALRLGLLEPLPRVFALHCDPRLDVGTIGTRIGAITSAADSVRISVTGRGGHTSRPHLTEDVVSALAHIASTVPSVISRRIDVRSVVSVVWGQISAGTAHNAIPSTGMLSGTLRCLDAEAWEAAGQLLSEVVTQCAAPFGVEAEIDHVRGVPPVINQERETTLIEEAARAELGADAIALAPQSMGGEDFAWMAQERPASMFRLGTRSPGGPDYDLHMGDYAPDERAITTGVQVMASVALRALAGEQH